jgi:iron complex outermembrane recepter protein
MLLAFTLVAPSAARADAPRDRQWQGVLSGTVTDVSGTPLEGARVLVSELDRAVLTDAGGQFRIPEMSAGRYTLEVRRQGYEARLVKVELPTEASLTVELRQSPVPIDPITVTVTRGAMSPTSSPLPASALGRDALDREQSVSLAHTLTQLPGVRALTTGREIGKPVIRGLSGSRVLVMSQGLRLEDYAWSDEDGPSVDAAMADRVEVIRGPASVLYGADAVGGVVNVIPRPIPDAAGGAAFYRGRAELGLASNNHEGDLIVRGEGASGPWGGQVTAAGRYAEALHTPAAELENTGFFSVDVEGALVRRGEWGTFTTRYVHNGGEFKLLEEDAPPGGDQGGAEEGGPERKLGDDRLQLLGNFPMGTRRLETRVQLQRHHIIELEDNPDSLALGIKTEGEVFNLVLNTGLGEALLHHSLRANISGTLGVTGEVQGSTSTGLIPLIPDAGMSSGGIFLLEKMDQGPLTLMAGLRSDLKRIDAHDQPGKRTFGAVTWSGGAALRVGGGVTLTGNVGSAWRAPTLFELYASGPRLGEARYEIGRADLDKETSLNLDGGLRWDGPRVHLQGAAYRNAFKGFLFIQPTDQTRGGYQVFDYEQADATLVGGEASLEVDPTPFLSVTGRSDYVRGTNELLDQPLPLIPPARYDVEAELHGPWPSADDQAYASVEVEHEVAPTRLNPYDLPVGAYTLLHMGAGVRGDFAGRHMGVDLRVRNLLNKSYKDFLNRYKAFALNPGRDIALRVRIDM